MNKKLFTLVAFCTFHTTTQSAALDLAGPSGAPSPTRLTLLATVKGLACKKPDNAKQIAAAQNFLANMAEAERAAVTKHSPRVLAAANANVGTPTPASEPSTPIAIPPSHAKQVNPAKPEIFQNGSPVSGSPQMSPPAHLKSHPTRTYLIPPIDLSLT